MGNIGDDEQGWGRVLICGGTDWPKLGRKDRSGKTLQKEDDQVAHPDLLTPCVLRSLSAIKIKSIHTSCSAVHFVCISVDGTAYLFGRNGAGCLGLDPSKYPAVSEHAPLILKPSDLDPDADAFVDAACGRNHTLLVTSSGRVYSAGGNALGQCGHSPCAEITEFKEVTGFPEGENAVKASAGLTFSIVLCESGKVYAFGSGEKGQLGSGSTGEHIATGNKVAFDVVDSPYLIKSLDGIRITHISSGQQHSAALSDNGTIYVWGYNGYCRLGLGDQKDVLKPKPVPQFSEAKYVACGPSSTIAVDKQGMFWMAGKWKNTGEGSSGSPYSTFRVMQDIMGCKIKHACSGGVTHFIIVQEDDGVMTVAWGQNASNGELGLGLDQPKSATKPTEHMPLHGLNVMSVAAGQNTTLFLVSPPFPEDADVPRYPEELDGVEEVCLVCRKGDEAGDSLECERCDAPYHPACLTPPLSAVPEGEWFCPHCEKDPEATLPGFEKLVIGKRGKAGASKRKIDHDDDGGKKRKKA